ncbi:hypothetical protein TNCV_4133441 [Trichonephila clavipes]|uniref:Uncharacterized protein n=1 Tax=Trichonephila clavipes TaxID=2585209 RepID=A0A8X6V7H9_TRICX|nr:hypothetical protein TNCV_4133441 [Trichonephila clavipes]
MARLLGNWSRLEVRSMIRFLWAKNVSASTMGRQNVSKLCHSFQSGRQDVESRNTTDIAVKSFAETWLNRQRPDFYQDGLNKLVLRSDKCLIRLGDFVEM